MSVILTGGSFPVRLADRSDFLRVLEFFQQCGFDDATLCRALKMDGMSELGAVQWDQVRVEELSRPLRWAIHVFVRGLQADEVESRNSCGNEVYDAFLTLGLLRPARKNPTSRVSPVWVYPVDGFIIVSDRRDDPDGDPFVPAEDVVFPAIYGGTLRFLRLLPEVLRGDALDLCGGSGIGALHLSRTARSAATADVTKRSALFAEFNARLNDVAVESLCGDLYGPVERRQFDVITAHPPFVPAIGQTMVYRDGGDSGEEVTRRIIEGLPTHLRPGGTAMILCVACDSGQTTFEHRAHSWLGPTKNQFDVVFGLEKVLSVEEVVESIRKRGQHIGDVEAQQLLARLRSFGTRQFVYGALVLQRSTGGKTLDPYRIRLTPAGTWADFERLLGWQRRRQQPDFGGWLAKSRPRLAPRLELTARHLVQDGQLVPAEFVFSIEDGFQAALRPDAWIVPLVARLEGSRSVQEVYEAAALADELPEGFSLDAFLDLVQTMIERRFLEVDTPCETGRRVNAG